jgi:hypothetical protein
MIAAKRFLRIDVWLRHRYAVATSGPGATVFGRMTIWPRASIAHQHEVYVEGSFSILTEDGDRVLLESGDYILLEAA